MKKLFVNGLLLFASIFITGNLAAQVRGISYTVSPFGEYNWFDDNSGLKDGYFVGGQLGFGFGQNIELRGMYSQGLSLVTDINKFGFTPTEEQILNYTASNIKMSKYGGELKLNLSRGKLLPYLTVGTGVQSIGIDTMMASKQIYVNAGLGIQFTAADRYTIGIQAINQRYNYSAVNSLLTNSQRDAYNLLSSDFPQEQLENWTLKASLILYLGGRKPGEASDVDKAYWDNFSGGFRGLNVPIEFQASRMDFHRDLAYRDTWMAGGGIGLNFGPLVGVRAFYWKALQEGSYTDFDDLAMYGAEARFLLNEGKGFTPWITLGGGKIDVGETYIGVDSTTVGDETFAMGGLGIDIPFSKYVKATGYARSILTTETKEENFSTPTALKNSWNYGVSLNFTLGKSKKKIEVVKRSEYDDYVATNQIANEQAINDLKSQYQSKISDLEIQMAEALEAQDIEAAKAIQAQKNEAQNVVNEIGKYNNGTVPNQPINSRPNVVIDPRASNISMTPAEFQLLLRDLMENKSSAPQAAISMAPATATTEKALTDYKTDMQYEKLNDALADLTKQLDKSVASQEKLNDKMDARMTKSSEKMTELLEELRDLSEQNAEELAAMKARQSAIEKGIATGTKVEINPYEVTQLEDQIESTNIRLDEVQRKLIRMSDDDYEMSELDADLEIDEAIYANKNNIKSGIEKDTSGLFSKITYKGMSGFIGANVGGPTTFNVGYRMYYQLGASHFEFMPESFFGFGSPSTFGLSGNLVYNLDQLTKSTTVNPYIGLGAGMMKIGDSADQDKLAATWNFIAGTSLNVWKGDLFADFTARNGFKYNQIIVGYRFPF